MKYVFDLQRHGYKIFHNYCLLEIHTFYVEDKARYAKKLHYFKVH